ncbi:MAG: hypothetical protein WCJ09_19890 [Planctomycetota bacterium]
MKLSLQIEERESWQSPSDNLNFAGGFAVWYINTDCCTRSTIERRGNACVIVIQ